VNSRLCRLIATSLLVVSIGIGTIFVGSNVRSSVAADDFSELVQFDFDAEVSEQDRDTISEGIRLAQELFADGISGPIEDHLFVTALSTVSPGDANVLGVTIGRSIAFYTASSGWLHSSPAERLWTVIHEYVHFYQFSMVGDSPARAAWFEEGMAEFLSMQALAGVDIVDQREFDGYEAAWLQFAPPASILPSLESPFTFQREGLDSYPLCYFAIAHLFEPFDLETVNDFYSALDATDDFDTAFAQTFGISTAAYYQDFELWEQELPDALVLIPDEFLPFEGEQQSSPVTLVDAPLALHGDEQVIFQAETDAGSICSLTIALPSGSDQLIFRDTFANNEGEAFWLVTVPPDTGTGNAAIALTCGANTIDYESFVTS
jgi:hypothetical protein